MTWSNGYRRPSQLGGPMDIGEEYRWNLPVITYGFDPEFVDYFGQDGIAAVEKAIAMLTNLPPASQIVLQDYDLQTRRPNSEAKQLGLLDLKSVSLQLLLIQLGLAEPTRNTWTIRERNGDAFSVILRNFDPASLDPTNVVNSVSCDYLIYTYPDGVAEALETFDSSVIPSFAAADSGHEPGVFRYALSRDDVGGLRYLYSRHNINIEPLPRDVSVVGGSDRPVPDVAPRPGIEKLNFLRMTWNTNARTFNAVTSLFDLTYVTNAITRTQHVQRVVTAPDILFEARDLGGVPHRTYTGEYYFAPELLKITDVARWQNLSSLNDSSQAGPGVIPPGARLTFGKVGKYSELGGLKPYSLGSFDESSNAPLIFLGNERAETVTLDTYMERQGTDSYFTTVLLGTVGAVYQIDSSTNLADWTPLASVTNDNVNFGYFSFRDKVTTSKKFYRALRQD